MENKNKISLCFKKVNKVKKVYFTYSAFLSFISGESSLTSKDMTFQAISSENKF